jgi:hypothetical protein
MTFWTAFLHFRIFIRFTVFIQLKSQTFIQAFRAVLALFQISLIHGATPSASEQGITTKPAPSPATAALQPIVLLKLI